LLQYARPQQGSAETESVDVNEVVRQIRPLVQHLRRQKPFQLELELNAVEPVRFNTHELQQVLVNLISNAVHALPDEEGRILVHTAEWSDQGCVIHIEDNGQGIPHDQIDSLFNPFFTTRPEGEGTGLGLSVSYGLVRHYGGNITVQSKLGEGARFSVWLLREARIVADEETLTEQFRSMESRATP